MGIRQDETEECYLSVTYTQMGNVEVRKNKEGYELDLNALIYSELLMSNVRFLVTNQICRVLP